MKTFDQEELTEGNCKASQGLLIWRDYSTNKRKVSGGGGLVSGILISICLIDIRSGKIEQVKTIRDPNFKSSVDEDFTKIPSVRQNKKIITDAKLIIDVKSIVSCNSNETCLWMTSVITKIFIYFTIMFSIGAKFHRQLQLKFIKIFVFV